MLTQKGESPIGSGNVRGTHLAFPFFSLIRSKLAPAPGFVLDLKLQKDFIGRPIRGTPTGVAAQAFNRLSPFIVRDLIEAFNEEGLTATALVSTAFFGTGASTFETVNDVSLDIFGVPYEQLPRGRPGQEESSASRKRVREELERRETFPTGRLPQFLQGVIQPARRRSEEPR